MRASIAIDGPAGAGKSTVAKGVAKRLGIPYLDTGAMYRAIAVYVKRHGAEFTDGEAVERLAAQAQVQVRYLDGVQHVYLDGEDCTHLLRQEEMGRGASLVSVYPSVRDRMASLQREIGTQQCVVMDGREIGTNVLPHTPNKFFVTASVECRAMRRVRELEARGEHPVYEEILEDIRQRDRRDSERAYMPLRRAEDAKLIDTTFLTVEEAITAVVSEVV